MIYVDGAPFAPDDSSLGIDTLIALMEHPALVSASNTFKSMAEHKLSISDSTSVNSKISKWVYVFQREFATVDPALVDLVGTDEATTCVGVAIRNRKNGMISVAHMDCPKIVDVGLSRMLSSVSDQDSDDLFDVHLVGGFDDIPTRRSHLAFESQTEMGGYSYPLCAKIIETLRNRSEKFQIQTLHVLGHNTKWDSEGNGCPIFQGFVVETLTGSIIPAIFDKFSRCPDEIVRRIRVTSSSDDPNWTGKLLDAYDTKTDRFVIAPCSWSIMQKRIALALQNLSEEEILLTCSTSPSAENDDFVYNERRKWDYLIRHPDWRETFPSELPRVFYRNADGSWTKA